MHGEFKDRHGLRPDPLNLQMSKYPIEIGLGISLLVQVFLSVN